MSKKGLLCAEHLDGRGWQLGQASTPSRPDTKTCGQHGSDQGAEAGEVLLCKGAQSSLEAIEAGLDLYRSRSMVAEAPPFRTSGQVHRRLKPELPSQTSQIIGISKRSSGAHAVLIEVQVRQEQTKPFHEP